MTVAELIAHLQTFPPDVQVVYSLYSEQCLLEARDVTIGEAQPPRPDGWVHYLRPDKPRQQYVMFPGN